MAESAYRIGVAGEDEAHFALATALADGVLLRAARQAGADYIDEGSLQYYRRYAGISEGERYYPLGDAARDTRDLPRRPMIGGRPVRLTGHIGGKPMGPEAGMWRRLFALFLMLTPRVLRALFFDESVSRPPSRDELPDLCERALKDLELLEERGTTCGLAGFLDDLRRDLAPLIVPGAGAGRPGE